MSRYEIRKAMLFGIEELISNIRDGNYPNSFRNDLLEIMKEKNEDIKRFKVWEKKIPIGRKISLEGISEDQYKIVEEEVKYEYQRNEFLESMFRKIMEERYDVREEIRNLFKKWEENDEDFQKGDLYIYDYIDEEEIEEAKKKLLKVRKEYAGLVGKSVMEVRANSPAFPSPFEALDYYKNEISMIEGGYR